MNQATVNLENELAACCSSMNAPAAEQLSTLDYINRLLAVATTTTTENPT